MTATDHVGRLKTRVERLFDVNTYNATEHGIRELRPLAYAAPSTPIPITPIKIRSRTIFDNPAPTDTAKAVPALPATMKN